MSQSAEKDAAFVELFETIEDAVGVGTLDLDTVEQIARYLIVSGYTRVLPPANCDNCGGLITTYDIDCCHVAGCHECERI